MLQTHAGPEDAHSRGARQQDLPDIARRQHTLLRLPQARLPRHGILIASIQMLDIDRANRYAPRTDMGTNQHGQRGASRLRI